MASHRKPRPSVLTSSTVRAAAGLTTAALATVTLMSEQASAAPAKPKPSINEVKAQVDQLFRQAELATDRYNGAKEETEQQRSKVNGLLDQVAKETDSLNQARRKLGQFAAEQYRTGGLAPTSTLLLAKDPQDFFDQDHLMRRLADGQSAAVDDFTAKQASATTKRREASQSLAELTQAQRDLAEQKSTVQSKLADARKLLSQLTEEEKQRLAALERQRQAEAEKRAADLAAKEQARQAQEQAQVKLAQPAASPAPASSTSSAAQKAVAFARAQLGKPYVWGATGPNSFDCSGLTQAAWKAAGVSLPRTTWDQVEVGTRVPTSQLQPGDLVFFFDDISHVGMYIGNGQMIHAPKPGDVVKIAPITEMPIYGNVRPA